MPSVKYLKEYHPTYDPWKYPERHEYTLHPSWPRLPSTVVSTYTRGDYGYQEQISDLNEVAEKFGYQNFCDTILHLHFDEKSGLLYSEPAAEPCPCAPLNEKLFGDVPEDKMIIYQSVPTLCFGLRCGTLQ